jgi:hypothetical protein
MRIFFKPMTIGNEVYYGIEFSLEDIQQLYTIEFPLYTLLAGYNTSFFTQLLAPMFELKMHRLGVSALNLQRRKTQSWWI